MCSRVVIALITGAGGSLIGLVGVFLVFWLTSRHDRKAEDARQAADAVKVTEQERADALRALLAALWSSPLDLQGLTIHQGGKALATLADATTHFAFVTWPEAWPVAQWALEQMTRVNHARSRFACWAWLPLYRRHLCDAYAHELTAMAGALFAWGQKAAPVEWFESRLDPPSRPPGTASRTDVAERATPVSTGGRSRR